MTGRGGWDTIILMKFGIVAAEDNRKAKELGQEIAKYLKGKNREVLEEKLHGAEVVLVLGGDGTLIHKACENVELNVPFVGINLGTLGFLTSAEPDDWKEAVEKLAKGEYFVSERMTLEARIVTSYQRPETSGRKSLKTNDRQLETTFRALNEVVVKGIYRVVDLDILVNEQKFISISGDGVIVSTQTGSTAYSLSAGGPIVDPEVDCFLITPINAHGLPIPSIALSPEDMVDVVVTSGDDVSLVIDGQEHTKVGEGQRVRVSKGKYRVKFAYFDKHHFLKALNAKFGLASRLAK